MSTPDMTQIEGWAILDLYGHNHLAGHVSTCLVGTSALFRVDVPEEPDLPGYTRFVGPGAIYSMTMVSEEVARAAIRAIRPLALTVYIPLKLPEEDRYDDYHGAAEEEC